MASQLPQDSDPADAPSDETRQEDADGMTQDELAQGHDMPESSPSSSGDPSVEKAIVSTFHARKLKERRELWKINRRVAAISIGAVAVFLLMAVASYSYNAGATAETFLTRAQSAGEAGNANAQIDWLKRYLLVRPDDVRRIVEIADVADAAAESAPRNEQRMRTETARKRLLDSIASLGSELPSEQLRLRKHLIRRLLQLGGRFYQEAERQVVLLDAPKDDPLANKALTLALSGQLVTNSYRGRESELYDEAKDYWNWLASQPAGVAFRKSVETNPDDLEVFSAFLTLVRNDPEQFRLPVGGMSAEEQLALQENFNSEIVALTENILKRTAEMGTSRANLVLYSYLSRGNSSQQAKASELLLNAAESAAERLAVTDPDTQVQSGLGAAIESADLSLGTEAPEIYWDYFIVLEGARIESASHTEALDEVDEEDRQRIVGWYETLMDFDHPDLSARIRQTTFTRAGSYARLFGDVDRAIALWQRGLEEVNFDNVELLGVLATEYAAKIAATEKDDRTAEEISGANETLQKLVDSIRRKQVDLRELTTGQLTGAERTAIQRTVEIAQWRSTLSEVVLRRVNEYAYPNAEKKGEGEDSDPRDKNEILIALLREALASPAEVLPSEKVRAYTILAELYRQNGAWDQAADALTRACDAMPSNLTLQLQAAEAWTRAGNQLKAIEYWRLAQGSDTLPVRIAAAHGALNHELRQSRETQDFSGVRREAADLRARMDQAISVELTEEQQDELESADAYLRVLEISIPGRGVSPAEHLATPVVAEKFAELASQHPDNALLQAYAAERLAAAGLIEPSKQPLQRLIELEGEDSVRVAMTRARQTAMRGKPIEAARGLMAFLEAHPEHEQAADVARLAADFANRMDEVELGYQAMRLVPKGRRSALAIFTLNRMANRLRRPEEAAELFAELRDAEGEEGTYWRYVEIETLVNELRARNEVIERDDDAMNEAQTLLAALIERRPRWGYALALKGSLSALAGRDETSVDELRQAISAGDERLATRRLYWSQLMRIGEYETADQDIETTALASGVDLDPYSEMQISVSLGMGDLKEALAEARQAAEDKPDDPISHLIVAKTASIAALSYKQDNSSNIEADQIDALVAEAREAIRRAIRLSNEASYPLLSTQLAIELAHGGSVTELSEDINASELRGYEKNLLLAQIDLSENRLSDAIKRYEAANDENPTLQVMLGLARLRAENKDFEGQAEVLQRAFRLAPGNRQVREKLATALIARDRDNVNWIELEKLLNQGAGVNPSNRLLYATTLANGNKAQLQEALRMLRALVLEANSKSYLASIALGATLIKSAGEIPEEDPDRESKKAKLLDEARTIYARNAQGFQPAIGDLYRYGLFLLTFGTDDDLDEVERLTTNLDSFDDGMIRSLELQLLLRQRRGQTKTIPKWLEGWAEKSKEKPGAKNIEIDLAGGTALIRLGFIDEGIALFKKAYETDESQLFTYVIALTHIKRHKEAAKVAAAHFEKYEDSQSAMLLVESLLGLDNPVVASAKYSDLLSRATKLHDDDAPLLESVATWAMQAKKVEQAIRLYKKVLEIDSKRLRTLNNLAMAYAQLPGMTDEGLVVIDQALLGVSGKSRAELLDTKGTLLLRANRLSQALDVFEDAIEIVNEPRFHFHKILVLIRQDKLAEATKFWKRLDRKKLNVNGLTPEERAIYEGMVEDFEARGAERGYEVKSL
ncbi:MAG: tetratricopeptide repeat protein [Planctomycetota bacterium]